MTIGFAAGISADIAGIGSFNHLAAVEIENAAGIQVQHVPLPGSDAITTLLDGQVDAVCSSAFNCLPYIQSGEMRKPPLSRNTALATAR